MKKYTDIPTEKLKDMLKVAQEMEKLSAFNDAQTRKTEGIDYCFIKAELIRRGEM